MILAAVIPLQIWFNTKSGTPSLGRTIKSILLFLACFFLMAVFWLIRNYAALGNPVYPIDIPIIGELLGFSQAPSSFHDNFASGNTEMEWVRSSAEWFVYPWLEWHYNEQNFKGSSGLGLYFATFVPVALIIAPYCIKHVHGQQRFLMSMCFAATIFGSDVLVVPGPPAKICFGSISNSDPSRSGYDCSFKGPIPSMV